jgi:hypothetical protein
MITFEYENYSFVFFEKKLFPISIDENFFYETLNIT